MRHSEILAEVEKFELLCNADKKIDEIEDCIKQTVFKFGFEYFSLLRLSESLDHSGRLILTNFPTQQAKELCFDEAAFYHPINRASQLSLTGVKWSNIKKYIPLSENLSLALQRVYTGGLTIGFSIYYPLPRGLKGIFSVARSSHEEVSKETSAALYYFGASVFQISTTIKEIKVGPTIAPNLSPREKACVELIAQGHSDPEIASLLYLSPETIREYVSSARARLKVRRRGQLVYECIKQGLLECPRWPHD